MTLKPGTYLASGGAGKPRLFLRHPTDVPIVVEESSYTASEQPACNRCLRDAGLGGICFASDVPYPVGTHVDVKISITRPPFHERCTVAWCRPAGDQFEIGVAFRERGKDHIARMVEQVCHIEHYRRQVREQEGRELTPQEAALEWIGKYAEQFPRA